MAGGYTPAVADMNELPRWLENLRRIVGTDDRGALTRTAERIPMKLSQLQKILSGENQKPQIDTLERIVRACGRDLEDLFARPEEEAGHAHAPGEAPGFAVLELFAKARQAADGEMPAEDTWRGDVIKAIAVLTRALSRGDSGETSIPPAKAGR